MLAPIHFTKKAVNQLNILHKEANLPKTATFCITVEDFTPNSELVYGFSYKYNTSDDEMRYESNGFPYILDTETAIRMVNAQIDYSKGNFVVDLDENSLPGVLAEA